MSPPQSSAGARSLSRSRIEELVKKWGGVLDPVTPPMAPPRSRQRVPPVTPPARVPAPAADAPSLTRSRIEELVTKHGGVFAPPTAARARAPVPRRAWEDPVSQPLGARAPTDVAQASVRGPEDVTFSEQLGAGIDDLQSYYGSFLQWAGEAADAVTQTDTAVSQRLQEIGEDIAVRNRTQGDQVPRMDTTMIDSPETFGLWLKSAVGRQLPIMGPTAAMSWAGAVAGTAILPGPGTVIGGLLGGLTTSFAMNVGIQQAGVKERDPELERPGAVFVGGSAMAALDYILPGRIGSALLRRFGPNAARQVAEKVLMTPVSQRFLVRTGRGFATGMLTEGVTEALQEAIEDVTVNYATQLDPSIRQAIQQSVESPTLPGRMRESFFTGAALGGLFSGSAAAVSGRPPTPPYMPEAEPETTPEQAATFFRDVPLGEEVVPPVPPRPAPTARAAPSPGLEPIAVEPVPAVEPTPAVVTPAEGPVSESLRLAQEIEALSDQAPVSLREMFGPQPTPEQAQEHKALRQAYQTELRRLMRQHTAELERVSPAEAEAAVEAVEGAIPESRPQRLRESAVEVKHREAVHKAEVNKAVLAAAKRIDPTVNEGVVLAALNQRRDAMQEIQLEGEEYSSDALLRAIADRGGIWWERDETSKGEIEMLKEGHRGGNVQRATGPAIRVFRSTGLSPASMWEHLSQEPRFNRIEDANALLTRIADAIADRVPGSDVLPGTQGLGIDLATRWWADEAPVREAVEQEPTEPALTYEQYVAESERIWADPGEFNPQAQIALDEANPAHAQRLAQTPELEAPADVLDTGEVQTRLPEAGVVREQETPMPEAVEDVPFALRRQARDDRIEAPTLFGTSPLVRGELRRADEASAATYEFTGDDTDPESGAAPGGEVQQPLALTDVMPAPYGTGSDPATKPSPIEFPELVLMARELIRRVPRIVKQFRGDPKFARFVAKGEQARIEMLSDLFKEGNAFKLAQTLGHELGHAIDWLPQYVLKRGNMLGRLQSLHSLQRSFTTPDGRRITNPTIRKEAVEFSAAWRPWNRATATKKDREYRDSGKELYADLISGLLVRPRMVEARAPTFYKAFFDLLDRKPQVAESYMGLQDLLSGTRKALVTARRKRITQGFEAGTIKMRELQERRLEERAESQSPSGFWARFKREYIDPDTWADWNDKLEAMGKVISDDENPYFQLQEQRYIGGKLVAFNKEHLFPIYSEVTKNGIDWNSFGESLLYERIIDGDRSEKANPDGMTLADAKERYAHLREALGPEKVQVLDKQIAKFRSVVQDVSLRGYRAGLYSDSLYASMYKNKAYAMFQAVEHIEEEVSAQVFGQVGMTGEIRNPADATFARMLATLSAIERNKMVRTIERELTKHFGGAIEPATTKSEQRGGRYVQVPQEPRDSRYGLLTYVDKGRRVGFYVEAYVAESVKRTSIGHNNTLVQILSKINSGWFRPLFITFNLGFMGVNIVRDFNRYWKNIPGMTIARAMRRYLQAVPFARVRSFGMPKNPTAAHKAAEKDLLEAEKIGVLSVSYSDTVAERYDREVGDILRTGRDPDVEAPAPRPLLRPILAVLDTIRNMGNFIETLPKAAGIYELRGEGQIKDLTIRQRAAIRRDIGSPDFQIRGKWTALTNNLFLFSNAMVQGVRSDVRIALDPKRPKTLGLSGWWWKTIGANIIPKVFMMAALYGFLGDALRRFYERVTEYDRINYIPIPLFWGESGEGNVAYFRMPQGDAGRVVGAVFYLAGMSGTSGRNFISGLTSVLDYSSGQMPSITPMISGPLAIREMLIGRNPRDAFRGRNVLTADEQSARGWPAWKKFLGWEFQQLGGGVIWRFYPGERAPERKNLGQTIIELPILSTVLGRFIRFTQYGDVERMRNVVGQVRKQMARGRIAERQRVNTVIRDFQEGKASAEGLDELAIGIALDVYPDDLNRAAERAPAIRSRLLNTAIQTEAADPFLNAYAAARSNRERAAIAVEWMKSRR
jgi:hypothetical protein